MAFVEGIGFFFIFVLEIILTIWWIKKFRLWECYKPNTVSFQFYVRWFLVILPIGASLDNLRLFFGSFLNESSMSSNASKNYFIFVSLLHFVLLSFIVTVCALFITTPKLQPITVNDNDNNMVYGETSSRCNNCIWFFSFIINFILFCIGMYTWITLSINHSVFDDKYNVYKWGDDTDYIDSNANIIQMLGLQQPVFAVIFTLIMNIIIWRRYKYYIPFILTLLSTVGMGLLVATWPAGFFFIGNFFEWTLFLSFYKLDVFMYWLDERKLSGINQHKYYEL